MQVIKGKFNVAKVMIDEIDPATHEQIRGFVNNPAFGGKHRIAIMPDCHKGVGSCIGFTMELGDYIMPQIVGVDIGCGMLAANLSTTEIDPAKLDDYIKANIPAGHCINAEIDGMAATIEGIPDICAEIGAEKAKVYKAIGSLGGGNHFIEADRDEAGNVWIVIHSGSRNFGKRIAEYYQGEARKLMEKYFIDVERDMEFILRSESVAGEYLIAMRTAQLYASANRKAMMTRIVDFLGASVGEVVESVHNYIDFDDEIIRKGAIRAHEGEKCIIPFNSAEGSALCVGKGNKDWNQSAPHGAGRLMSRTQAFDTLDYKEYQAKLAGNGVFSTTANSSTLDEAPMAYKSKDTIIDAIKETVDIVSMLKPFYNFKASEGGRRK